MKTKTKDDAMDDEMKERRRRYAKPGAAPDEQNEALLRDLVSAFVAYPKEIETKSDLDAAGNETLTLKVHGNDQPRVWGQGGRHIQALRTMFQFIGARDDRRITLLLVEPRWSRSVRPDPQPFRPNDQWDATETVALLNRLLSRILRKPFTISAYSPAERALAEAGLSIQSSADYTSILEIDPDSTERNVVDALLNYARPIFHAIGKNNGRELKLDAKKDEARS